MSKVVIVSSSMRKGNSDKLCDEFEKGAKTAGHIVSRINLRDINMKFCKACSDCYTIGKCQIQDDMNSLYEIIKNADILVLSTPIYYSEICGQLKTFFDRMYPIYNKLKAKKAYIIASCYQNDKKYLEDSVLAINKFLYHAGNIPLEAIIHGENTDEIDDITQQQKLKAYKAGLSIK